MRPEILTRRIPGHYWIRLGLSFTGKCEPGHCWLYSGLIRRDAWRIGRLGIYLLRMPQTNEMRAALRHASRHG